MERDPILTLIGLAAVALFAGVAVWMLLRVSDRGARQDALEVGYPADRFPRRDLVATAQLAALAAVQSRLLSVYDQLPARGEAAVWLRAFLAELRALMDSAYRVAAVSTIYGDTALLDRVVAEVQQTEAQIAAEAMRHLLRQGGDFDEAPLDERLAVLRRFAQELAGSGQ